MTGPALSTEGIGHIEVTPVQSTTAYRLTLTPRQAQCLYNDVTWLLRKAGQDNAQNRVGLDSIFALYDGLYVAGVDGSG